MKVSDRGIQFIRLHEGVRRKAYKDPVGILTIGVGFTMRSTSFQEWWRLNRRDPFTIHSTMTDAEIDDALAFLISREFGRAVNRFLGGDVPQHVYDAMVSAVFNLGVGALQWRWAQAAKAGDYARAAELLTVTGTTASGKRLDGLVRRRKEEALLLKSGVYTGVAAAPKPPVEVAKPDIKPADPKPVVKDPVTIEKPSIWDALFAFILKLFTRRK
jgi:lysozyme